MIKWMMALATFPAGATCVSTLDYPTQLRLPTLERWASDSLFVKPTAELECTLVQKLSALFDALERRPADESARRRRGTHAKGTCVAGTFRPRLDARLGDTHRELLRTADLFGGTQPRATHARFANAASRVQADWEKDVRGLSLKVDLGGGRVQDFSFNNVPRFQIDSLDSFILVMEMTKAVMSGEIERTSDGPSLRSVFSYFQLKNGTLAAGRDLYALARLKKLGDEDTGWHDSYLTQTYWSTTAFALGDSNRDVNEWSRVAKFGALPCHEKGSVLTSEIEARNASRLKGVERPNYLSDDLRATLVRAPACFHVFVEFLDEEKSVNGVSARARELVEDPSITWHAPTYTVGDLLLDRTVDQATCDDGAHAIDVLRNQSGIYGVGQINRARAYFETARPVAR